MKDGGYYTQIRLSGNMVSLIDDFMHEYPFFTTRTDFVKHCIRSYIERNNGGGKMDHHNTGGDNVGSLDKVVGDKGSGGCDSPRLYTFKRVSESSDEEGLEDKRERGKMKYSCGGEDEVKSI